MKLHIARHCETDWNKDGLVQGQHDTELNHIGIIQAEQLAAWLVGIGISRIVCSDLRRAVQTAEIVAARLGITFQPDQRLRECHFGWLEGKSHAQFAALCGPFDIFSKHKMLDFDFRRFGGESAEQLIARMRAVIEEIRSQGDSARTLVVSHGRSLHTMLAWYGVHCELAPQGQFMTVDI